MNDDDDDDDDACTGKYRQHVRVLYCLRLRGIKVLRDNAGVCFKRQSSVC